MNSSKGSHFLKGNYQWYLCIFTLYHWCPYFLRLFMVPQHLMLITIVTLMMILPLANHGYFFSLINQPTMFLPSFLNLSSSFLLILLFLSIHGFLFKVILYMHPQKRAIQKNKKSHIFYMHLLQLHHPKYNNSFSFHQ